MMIGFLPWFLTQLSIIVLSDSQAPCFTNNMQDFHLTEWFLRTVPSRAVSFCPLFQLNTGEQASKRLAPRKSPLLPPQALASTWKCLAPSARTKTPAEMTWWSRAYYFDHCPLNLIAVLPYCAEKLDCGCHRHPIQQTKEKSQMKTANSYGNDAKVSLKLRKATASTCQACSFTTLSNTFLELDVPSCSSTHCERVTNAKFAVCVWQERALSNVRCRHSENHRRSRHGLEAQLVAHQVIPVQQRKGLR